MNVKSDCVLIDGVQHQYHFYDASVVRLLWAVHAGDGQLPQFCVSTCKLLDSLRPECAMPTDGTASEPVAVLRGHVSPFRCLAPVLPHPDLTIIWAMYTHPADLFISDNSFDRNLSP